MKKLQKRNLIVTITCIACTISTLSPRCLLIMCTLRISYEIINCWISQHDWVYCAEEAGILAIPLSSLSLLLFRLSSSLFGLASFGITLIARAIYMYNVTQVLVQYIRANIRKLRFATCLTFRSSHIVPFARLHMPVNVIAMCEEIERSPLIIFAAFNSRFPHNRERTDVCLQHHAKKPRRVCYDSFLAPLLVS